MKRNDSHFRHDFYLRAVKAFAVLLVVGCFAGCWCFYYAIRIPKPFYIKGNLLFITLYLIIYIWAGKVFDAFSISINRASEIAYSQVLACASSDFIIYIVICLQSLKIVKIWPGFLCFIAQAVFATLWAFVANAWYFRSFAPKESIVVYDMRNGLDRIIEEYGLNKKYHVLRVVEIHECLEHPEMLDDIDVVFFSGIHSHERNVLLKRCVEYDTQVFVIPRIGDVIMSGAQQMHMFHLPMLSVTRYNPSLEFVFIKRVFDILISLFAIIVLSPFMLVVAICIKCYDGGPVLYKQSRLTKNGKVFQVMKFRSMRVDAERDGVARLSSGDHDDRITPVGRIIRKIRFDELPQFFNILKGDMSFIGPRPERPEIAEQYEKEIPEFKLRLQAKAGLTGYAQVYGKYNTTPYDKLQMDLIYIANPGILQEISILFATVKILFLPESTEGVAEGQVTAMCEEDSNT